MNRRLFIKKSIGGIFAVELGTSFISCGDDAYYLPDDFEKAPKADSHFHYNVSVDAFLKYASSVNMHILTINVDSNEAIDEQFFNAKTLKDKYPGMIDFLGTFSASEYGNESFTDKTIAQIEKCMNAGAKGIKIWKNIGMVIKDSTGKYVMADNQAFVPVFAYLEKEGIPLVAHLGEPRNCWLPYEQITMGNDLSYYRSHPEYHMYQHPDAPSYNEQIAARDHLLDAYPRLKFIGAHIGSLEWNLDEVARRFDKYPNFTVDLSARMGHVHLHTIENRDKVKNFFNTYQDRIMYGSDTGLGAVTNIDRQCQSLYNTWRSHWIFLATGETIPADKFNTANPPTEITGLRLPRSVVDKIFYSNFKRMFG